MISIEVYGSVIKWKPLVVHVAMPTAIYSDHGTHLNPKHFLTLLDNVVAAPQLARRGCANLDVVLTNRVPAPGQHHITLIHSLNTFVSTNEYFR